VRFKRGMPHSGQRKGATRKDATKGRIATIGSCRGEGCSQWPSVGHTGIQT